MAFGKPPVKPKPTLKPINQNPALAAASKAGRDSTLAARTISSQNTGTTTDDDAGDTLIRHHTGRGTAGAGLDGGPVRSRLNDFTADDKSNTEDDEDASSENSFVSASDGLQSDYKPEPMVARPRHIHSNQQRAFTASRDPTATSQNSMTVNSLANAMVASALASSRSQSPIPSKKPAPAPPPTRRSTTSIFANAQAHMSQSSRTPSPSKPSIQKQHTGGRTGMRTTMRKTPRSSDDEDEGMVKRGRKNLMKKHPNKHHEGDRKRWRDAVSDRERKRYEGLWASNKGLFTSPSTMTRPIQGITSSPSRRNSSLVGTRPGASDSLRSPPEDCVSSLVVRDIWSRSRLPDDVLSDIWELVDRSGTGMLSRDEFVAGVWLVDQRLKGRKLPQRVGDSVWVSVGALGGVKVKDKHKHTKGAGRKARPGDSRDLR
ncbi:Increased rDNA silencing protein [Pseudogymnoascus australis]